MDSGSACALGSPNAVNANSTETSTASIANTALNTQLMHAHEVRLINGIVESLLDNADEYRRAIFGLEQLLDTMQCRLYNRVQALEQLQAHVVSLGSKPATTRSALGAAFASLLSASHLFSRNRQQDLMQDIDRGERTLKILFKQCLTDKRLSPAGRDCVSKAIDQLSVDQCRPAELWSSQSMGVAQAKPLQTIMSA